LARWRPTSVSAAISMPGLDGLHSTAVGKPRGFAILWTPDGMQKPLRPEHDGEEAPMGRPDEFVAYHFPGPSVWIKSANGGQNSLLKDKRKKRPEPPGLASFSVAELGKNDPREAGSTPTFG
jgi:hypothetical protein